MWHVSAPYRPCIDHRTGYSLRQMPGFSGLASADFEGFLHTATSGFAPGFFYARCARNQVDRSDLRLKTVADLDGRTRAARRARAVVAELVKALGGPDAVSPGQRQACER